MTIKIISYNLIKNGDSMPISARAKIATLVFVLFFTVTLLIASIPADAWTPMPSDRVDTSSLGDPANSPSIEPDISADGRYIAFFSTATNLVPGSGGNGNGNVYIKDTETGNLTLLDLDNNGSPAPDGARGVKISSDGQRAIFYTDSPLSPQDTNSFYDIYLRDLSTGMTSLVSVDSSGEVMGGQCNHAYLSPDGHYVVFNCSSNPQVYYIRDLINNTTEPLPLTGSGNIFVEGVTEDADYILYLDIYPISCMNGCTTDYGDLVVFNRSNSSIQRASVSSNGDVANSNGVSSFASITPNGRYVTFSSDADNLVMGDTNQRADVFIHDMVTGSTELVSTDSSGNQGDGSSFVSHTSSDGRYVSFDSQATNLAPGSQPINDCTVYIKDRLTSTTVRATPDNMVNNCLIFGGQIISANGQFMAIPVVTALYNWSIYKKSTCSLFNTCYNTPAGNNINVNLPPISLIYSQVNTAGSTTVTTSPTGMQPPTGFRLGEPPTYYDISTTATFSGTVEVCINYDPNSIQGSVNNLKLMHFDPSQGWVDITSSLDIANNIICGTTTSFSNFALMTEPTMQDLVDAVEQMNLEQGVSNSLDSKLQVAEQALDAQNNNDTATATNMLNAFINYAQAQSGRQLTISQSNELISFANNLMKILNNADVF